MDLLGILLLGLIGGVLIGTAVGWRAGHETGYRDGAWDQVTLPEGTRYFPPADPTDTAAA